MHTLLRVPATLPELPDTCWSTHEAAVTQLVKLLLHKPLQEPKAAAAAVEQVLGVNGEAAT
jgi:hypothetical protein